MHAGIVERKPEPVSLHRKPAKRRPPAPENPWDAPLWYAHRGYIAVYGERPRYIRYLQPGPGRRVVGVECSDAHAQRFYTALTVTAVQLDSINDMAIIAKGEQGLQTME
jgi:hypothetical protein